MPDLKLPTREEFELMMGGIIGEAQIINTVHIRDKHLITEKDRPWFLDDMVLF